MELPLFTTLENFAQSIIDLYGLRWHVETDIRYIMSCMDVGKLSAKSTQMIEKEIVLAQTAYNLVRHIAAMAASVRGIDPRRISFSRDCNLIRIVDPKMSSIDRFAPDNLLQRFISSLHQITNADRDRPPQQRKIIYRRRKFPIMTKTRSSEQKTLKNKLDRLN